MEAIPLIVLMALAFYVLVLRPMKRNQKRAADIQNHLKPGVEIITTAGVIGTVRSVDEDEVRLEIAPGVEIRLLTGAVGKILDPENTAGTGDGADAGETADEGGKGSGPASPTSH